MIGDSGPRDILQRAGLCRNSEQLHGVLICGVIPYFHDLPSLDASNIHLFSVLVRNALGVLQGKGGLHLIYPIIYGNLIQFFIDIQDNTGHL